MERNRREEMWKRKAEKQRIRNANGNAYWGSLAAHSTHTLYYTIPHHIPIPYHTIPHHTVLYYTHLRAIKNRRGQCSKNKFENLR